MSTSGFQGLPACSSIHSDRNTIGGMPTPPPTSSARGRFGSGRKGWPIGPSTLIEAGDQKLLIDAGRGATIRLYQLGVPLGQIDALCLTHYHSDHTVGIPDLWLTGWLQSHFATRTVPFRVIGPIGAKNLMSHLEKAYALDIRIRMEDEKLPPEGAAVVVQEFNGDGVVFDCLTMKVAAAFQAGFAAGGFDEDAAHGFGGGGEEVGAGVPEVGGRRSEVESRIVFVGPLISDF